MHGLRNRHFRRWVASGLAVLWLFTVLACAADTDDVLAASPAHSSQLISSGDSIPAHPPGNGGQDDACCQAQAAAVVTSSVVKLPHMTIPALTLPLALLLVLALPFTLLGVVAVPDQDAVRRRYRLLVHSLQAQAPPR